MRYILMRPGSGKCGQAVLGMLIEESSGEKIEQLVGRGQSGVRDEDIVRFLEMYNIEYSYNITEDWNEIPDRAILKLFVNDGAHWVLKWDEFFYDPETGIFNYMSPLLYSLISYFKIKI